MGRKTLSIIIAIFAVILVVFISGCIKENSPPVDVGINSDEPNLAMLQATVIDKVTNEPIENAIVYLGYHSPETWRCHTDNYGKCSLEDKHFVWGDYGLNVYKKGYNHYKQSVHFDIGSNQITIELEKKTEIPTPISIRGNVMEEVVAKGTLSENHFFKIMTDHQEEYYLLNEIGENIGFDEFVNKEVNINGYIEHGTIGWQGQDVEGIYVEEIIKI